MPTVEIDGGLIEYGDTGGDGPVVVFTHGFPMSGSQWRKVVPLMAGFRCVTPTLPMGSLFEGAMFLVFEIMVLRLTAILGQTAETMRARHTHME